MQSTRSCGEEPKRRACSKVLYVCPPPRPHRGRVLQATRMEGGAERRGGLGTRPPPVGCRARYLEYLQSQRDGRCTTTEVGEASSASIGDVPSTQTAQPCRPDARLHAWERPRPRRREVQRYIWMYQSTSAAERRHKTDGAPFGKNGGPLLRCAGSGSGGVTSCAGKIRTEILKRHEPAPLLIGPFACGRGQRVFAASGTRARSSPPK